MGLLTRTIEGVIDMFTKKELDPVSTTEQTPTPTPKPEEEWIWIEGYKGTDSNMKCRGYQFELGVKYDIPDDQEVEECKTGFHLCLNLGDVYSYYGIGNGNRYFRVKALVRKSDVAKYGTHQYIDTGYGRYPTGICDKLASKSIILQSELTIDEILKGTEAEQLPIEYKQLAINSGIGFAVDLYNRNTLVADGYSEAFAEYIIRNNLYGTAHAFGSQKDLSMDVKVLGILYNKIGGNK